MLHVLLVAIAILLVALVVIVAVVSVKLSKYVRYEFHHGLNYEEWGLSLKQKFLLSGLWSAAMAGYILVGFVFSHNLEGRPLLWWMVGLLVMMLSGGVLVTHDPKGKRMIAASRVPANTA
jgi:hypothetical protein